MVTFADTERANAAEHIVETIKEEIEASESPQNVRILKRLGLAVLRELTHVTAEWTKEYYKLFYS